MSTKQHEAPYVSAYGVGSVQLPDVTCFATGAVRGSDADGERWDLITPIGLRRLAETCAEGAAKYGEHNWQKASRRA